MQKSISPPVQHHRRDLLLQASSDEVSHLLLQASSEEVASGEWWASFAVFTDDREKSLLYWMPSLFRAFATEHEAEHSAQRAGLRFIEQSTWLRNRRVRVQVLRSAPLYPAHADECRTP
jgi:hypothetical protein